MIQLFEINNLASLYKVPPETIEKDYMICWILFCLSNCEIRNYFTFYGGTAIKRMYFEDHRFSEDIDLLSNQKMSLDQILKNLAILKIAKNKANLDFELDLNNIINKDSRIQLYIRYQGYEEIIGAPKVIRLDFSMDMPIYGKTEKVNLIESYSDIKNLKASLFVQSLNTILANKLGLLFDISRNEPRDVYDIWFLLKRKNYFAFNFKELKNIFKNKYGFNLNLNNIIYKLKNNTNLKKLWLERLRMQISELPDFGYVIEEIVLILNDLQGNKSHETVPF